VSLDPETASALADLQDVDVNETPPVELLSKVQRWQERLEDWLTQKTYSRPRSSCLHDSTVAPAGARQPANSPVPLPVVGDSGRRQNTIAANVKPARRTTLGSCRTADHDHFGATETTAPMHDTPGLPRNRWS